MKNLLQAILLLSCTVSLWGQTDREIATKAVEKNEIRGHIYFLADDLLEGRETGTRGLKIAASYLASMFRQYGVRPNPATGTYFQPVPLDRKSPPERLECSIGGKKQPALVPLKSGRVSYEGDAVNVGYGLEGDYEGKSVAGKFVITKAGSETARDARSAYRLRERKEALAKEKGVLGIIELLQAEETMWGFIEKSFNTARLSVPGEDKSNEGADFNYIWIRDTSGAVSESLTAITPIRFESSGESNDTVTSQNVIGVVEGTDPELKDEYIIYSAHYDHVGIGKPDESGDSIYNGARDNAIGTTTVLTMAKNLVKYPTKRSALFILFTAEEKGLLGSKYYVENPVIPLKQMVYCFNSDNSGYNDTSLATIIGLSRTTADENISNAVAAYGLKAIDDPAPEQGLFDRSDNVHFARKGIPAPTFHMGFTAFDEAINKYYHKPGDEADSLDYDYLVMFFRAYVLAGRLLGNDPQTPFWKVGDPYEEAGKALYGN